MPTVALLIPVLFQGKTLGESAVCMADTLVPMLLINAMYWLGNMFISFKLRVKYPLIHENKKRIFYNIIFGVIYTLSIDFLLTETFHVCGALFKNDQLSSYQPFYGITLFITAFVLTLYEALYYIQRWKESLAESERLKKENTQAQLEALKNQVNPHFLFNSLNTLASLIPADQTKAVDFTLKLSQMYRAVLELKEKQIVTLEEELNALDNYIYLVKTRFDESITFEIVVSAEALKLYVVPLALQLLVENAIKHNVVSHRRPLHVTIKSEGNQLLVANNLQPKQQQVESSGTGIRNINDRFKLTFDEQIDVQRTEHSFEVRMPLTKVEVL